MRMLALETGCPPGSLALFDNHNVVAQVTLDDARRTVQSLFPELDRLLKTVGWRPRDLQRIAVTVGPGSFTGLRIGVTFAKTWAFATGASLRGMLTLDVIAAQAETTHVSLWTVLDAQRRQLFVTRYERGGTGLSGTGLSGNGLWTRGSDIQIVGREQWLAELTGPCAITGEGLATLPDLQEQIAATGEPVAVLPVSAWRPRAVTVGRLALETRSAIADDDFLRLAPYYCRKSAAEEKAAEAPSRTP